MNISRRGLFGSFAGGVLIPAIATSCSKPDENRFVSNSEWDACGYPINNRLLKNKTCYGGLSLSSPFNIAAFVLCFPPTANKNRFEFLYRFFISEGMINYYPIDSYPEWIKNGFVTVTDGNYVDYDVIKKQIYADKNQYKLKSIGYDPWNASYLVNELSVNMISYNSIMSSQNYFRKHVIEGKIAHGCNPVIKQMVNRTYITVDSVGNRRIKNKCNTIGGVFASIMAMDLASKSKKERSFDG